MIDPKKTTGIAAILATLLWGAGDSSFPAGLEEDGEVVPGLIAPKGAGVRSAPLVIQDPLDPGIFDSPTSSLCRASVSPTTLTWIEPPGGVNSETGILISLPGISTSNDCTPGVLVPDSNWATQKNLIIATPAYRNLAFATPFDYGKLAVGDVLRGLGYLLDEYPEADRRRLYLLGGSGGGHLTLQTLQFTPHLWAEVHVQRAITRITVADDVQNRGYEEDPSSGWHVNLAFPLSQGSLDDDIWERYEAERALRSPQNHAGAAPVWAESPSDTVPPVYMMHGDADPTVDYQHFLDYMAIIEERNGAPPVVGLRGSLVFGNWTFYTIEGGNHSYPVDGAVNWVVPGAFTRIKEEEPTLSFTSTLPPQFGHTFLLDATVLTETTVTTVEVLATTSWEIYP